MPLAAVLSLVIVLAAAWLLNDYIQIAGRLKVMINIVLALIVVGILLWLINTYIPMAGAIKAILNMVVVVATCVGVLQALSLWEPVVRMFRNLKDKTSHPANDQRVPH